MKDFSNNRGMALVTVILMCSLLVSLYLRFLDEAGLQARIDARQEQITQARWAAMGGIDFAMGLLFEDKNTSDSYSENWSTTSLLTFDDPLMIGEASCSVKIIDESAKTNINIVNEHTLIRMFEFYDLGITASSSIFGEEITQGASIRLAHHILDYIDDNGIKRAMGSEIDEYEQLERSGPKNAPMDDINELLNIPGITHQLMVASGSRPGLSDLLTVYGDNLININDAPEGLIRAISGLPSTYKTSRIDDFYSKLLSKLPFTGLAGFTDFIVDYDWNIKQKYSKQFVTFTSWFKIEVHAQHGDAHRWVTALVNRDRYGKCHIVRYVEVP